MILVSLMLLAVAGEVEASGQISALTWSADDQKVLIVHADGGWEERDPSGKLLRGGRARLKAGFKLVDDVAFSADGKQWSASFIDENTTSVLTYDWGQAAPTSQFHNVARYGQELRWWNSRVVLRTDGDGVWLLGKNAKPERVCGSSYGIGVVGEALICNESSECWTAPGGGRFICEADPGKPTFEIRSTERSGAIEHQVSAPLEPGESVLSYEGFSPDGATFELTTTKGDRFSRIVIRMADGRVTRQPVADKKYVNHDRTYVLTKLFVGSTAKPLRTWATPMQSETPSAQLGANTYLLGAGSELYRLDIVKPSLERLMDVAPTRGPIRAAHRAP